VGDKAFFFLIIEIAFIIIVDGGGIIRGITPGDCSDVFTEVVPVKTESSSISAAPVYLVYFLYDHINEEGNDVNDKTMLHFSCLHNRKIGI